MDSAMTCEADLHDPQVLAANFLIFDRQEDEAVVYHAPSGDTHLLCRLSAAVIQSLQAPDQSAATGDIDHVLQVGEALGLSDDSPQFERAIGELVALGVISH